MNRFSIAIKLFWKNIKQIVVFEAIYKLFTTAVFTPLLVQMVRLALKLAGINYLTNARVMDFVMKPTTIAILFLLLILFAIFCLIEIGAISYCFDMSYHGYSANVTDMIKEGSRSAFRVFMGNNFLLIFFIIIIMPVTHLVAMSGYISSMQIPVFIVEFIKTKEDNIITYILAAYAFLLAFAVRWINSISYYTVEKMNFKNARRASVNLNKKRYLGLVASFIVWQLMFFGILVLTYVVLTFAVTKSLALVLKPKRAYSVSLSVARALYRIWNTVYSCLVVPISLAILGGFYYAVKETIHEQVVVPVLSEKKSYPRSKLKKAISVIVILSAFLNIIYISFDIGITRNGYNVQLFKKTAIAAHRGYSSEAPENTIPAFEAAIANFSDYVELDVQETKDGVVIVLHDSNFKRVAGINEKVWNVNYDEIMEYDVGKWFSKEYAGTTIPTLEQTMEMAKGRLKLNIEIKLTGHEKNLEKSVVELIEKYEMENECVVTSFQAKALKNVKKYNENIKTGYILNVAYGDFSGVGYADALSVNYSFATSALINNAHSAGKEVYVWTVNNADAINDMIKNGADMIITDDPVLAKETLTSYETTPYVVKLIKKFMNQ